MALLSRARPAIAGALDAAGLTRLGLAAQRRLAGPAIRAVNYHSVGPAEAARFREHLAYFREHFDDVNEQRLDSFFAGSWSPRRTGLMLTFDDGLRTDYDVVAPLLERYGFTGWFFVPVGMLTVPQPEQRAAAAAARITPRRSASGERIFLTIDEAQTLARRHVVGCHTLTHVRLEAGLSDEQLQREIAEAKATLAVALGHCVTTFCWVGGEEKSYSRRAAAVVQRSTYRYAFMTNSQLIRRNTSRLHLQRTNIEADFSLPLVRFQLSGAVDVQYRAKRMRVNRLTTCV